MSLYEHTAQSSSDLKRHLYDDTIFISVYKCNFHWLTEHGFTAYTPPEMKVFSQNPKFYKIEDDHIFLIMFRTQDLNSGKYDVREKCKLIKNDETIKALKNNEDIYDDFVKKLIQSNDIHYPSMIMYQSIKRDYLYYNKDLQKKQVSYFVNVDRIYLSVNSGNDFYISKLQFESGTISYIEVMVDGIIKSGEPLKIVWNELSMLTPTLENFFDFDTNLTEEIKFLFSAVVI